MTAGPAPALALAPSRLALRLSGVQLAVGLACLFAVVGVLTRPPIAVDETRYLTVAWEMRLSHDWLVPHLNGAAYSHKPPMLFWLINLAWSMFGDSSLVARLTPAAFLPLTVWLAGVLAARLGGQEAGNRAALITVSFIVFSVMGSLVMFDAMLTAASLAALIGVIEAVEGRSRRGLALFGVTLGAGLLIKGPAALIHILPAALLAPLWAPRRDGWPAYYLGLLTATAAGLLIALCWALPAAHAGGPQFSQAILWGQTAGRVVKAFDHARPVWFFAALAPALLLPWSFSRNLWSAALRREEAPDRRQRLPWIAAGATFLVFSLISGKQIHYVAPAMPYLAVGLANILDRRTAVTSEPFFATAPALFGLGMLLAGPLKLIGPAVPSFGLMTGGAVMIGGSLAVWRLRALPELAGAAASGAIFLGLHLAAALGSLGNEAPGWVTPWLQEDRPIAVVGEYAGEYGYAARLTHAVAIVAPANAGAWTAAHPDGILVYAYRGDPTIGAPAAELRPYKRGMLGVWTKAPLVEPADATASR